jgi:hypothetical protein
MSAFDPSEWIFHSDGLRIEGMVDQPWRLVRRLPDGSYSVLFEAPSYEAVATKLHELRSKR